MGVRPAVRPPPGAGGARAMIPRVIGAGVLLGVLLAWWLVRVTAPPAPDADPTPPRLAGAPGPAAGGLEPAGSVPWTGRPAAGGGEPGPVAGESRAAWESDLPAEAELEWLLLEVEEESLRLQQALQRAEAQLEASMGAASASGERQEATHWVPEEALAGEPEASEGLPWEEEQELLLHQEEVRRELGLPP